MAKYLWTGGYTAEGIRGVMREGGTGRLEAIRKLVEGVGGRLESAYWAFGKADFFIVVELPDNVSAAAAAMTVAGAGAVELITIPLLTAEEVDQAGKMNVTYRPPGA
jgi:uncharacterized protein with GYD domain